MDELKEDISLKNRKRLPQETKQKRKNVVLKNMIIAIFTIVYFMFLNIACFNVENSIYIILLQVFSGIFLVVSIMLFEKGYKKDNEGIFLNGVEALVISFVTMLMQFKFDDSKTIRLIFTLIFVVFILYYVLKSIIQARNLKKSYKASDVEELVKK